MSEHPLSVVAGKGDAASVPRMLDALIATGRALDKFPRNERSDQLLMDATEGAPLDLAALVGELLDNDLPLPVDLVQVAMARWFDNGTEIWEWVSKWCTSSMLAEDSSYWDLARAVWDVLDSLVDGPGNTDPERVAGHLTELASELERLDEADLALGCAAAALNFTGGAEDPAAVPVARLVYRLAVAAGDRDKAVIAQVRRALALAPRYADDTSVRAEAVDAFETVVRYLDEIPAIAPLRPYVERWLQDIPELRPLALVALATHPEDGPAEMDVAPFALTAQPVWDLEAEQVPSVSELLQPWMEFENLRLALESEVPRGPAAQASWDTWSIDHPAFRRAVPHGTSILREVDLDELLLVLQHEATHVLSMLSGVGLVATALRAAILDAEFELWTADDRQPSREEIDAEVWAVPRRGSIQALAQGEQLLELRRKLQIIQSVWAPVLEGIAVYGELSADPRANDEHAALVANLVANLVDIDIFGTAEKAGIAPDEMFRRTNAEAEERYGAAQDRLAPFRLRTYLDHWPEKYLAGYLAMRSVVSAWRQRQPGPLSGVAAFRVLLHAFRSTSDVAVPPLDSPLAGFEGRTVDGMLRWLDSIAALGAEDVARLAEARVMLRLHDGAMTVTTSAPPTDEAEVYVSRRFAEARRALQGDTADPARVHGATEAVRDMLADVAESLVLATTEPSPFAQAFIDHAMSAPALMPVARTTGPFWLNRPTRSLVCILRTTEEDYEHGKSSYQLNFFPLPEDSFADLEREMGARAATRLEVTRFADLIHAYDAEHGRLPGVNYLALSFGEWLHVTPRGWFFTKPKAPNDVRTLAARRLSPNKAVALEHRLGEGHGAASAARLAAWIESSDRWTEGGTVYPLEPWAGRVQILADEIAEAAEARAASVDERVLAWVLGDEDIAREVAADGLKGLYEVSPDAVGKLVHALQASIDGPVADAWLDDHVGDLEATMGRLMARQGNGWDVTAPRAGEMAAQV